MTKRKTRTARPMSGDDYVRRLREDFVFFVEQLWIDRGLDKIEPLGDVERDICLWLATGPAKRGALAFRGIGKTHLGTVSFTLWRLFNNPNTKVLIVSKSAGSAKDSIGLIREWIRNVWFLQGLDPKSNPHAQDSAFAFDVGPAKESRTPSVRAAGIDGQITGGRAHVVIGDDVETPENTKTVAAREDLERKVTEFDAIASYGGKEIVYFGTYHHEDSLYLKLPAKGYAFRSWPFVFPAPGDKVQSLAPMLQDLLDRGGVTPGALTCPHRFTDAHLASKQAEGFSYFAMQYRLIANLGETNRYPLRLSDLIVMPVNRDKAPITVAWGQHDNNGFTAIASPPSLGFAGDRLHRPAMIDQQWAAYQTTKAWIDPAGRGADETGFSAVGQLHSLLWAKAVRGLPGGHTEDDMDLMCEWLREFNVREFAIESNADTLGTYRNLFQSRLKRFFIQPGKDENCPQGWTCSMITDTKITHVTQQKELRIIGILEPLMSTHRLIIPPEALAPTPGLAPHRELQYQITRITKQKKSLVEDGRLDSLAGACSLFVHSLRVDPKAATDRHLIRQVEEWRAKKLRIPKPEHSWLDQR